MPRLVGKRVRCVSTGRVYRAVAQSGDEVLGDDEVTGERVGLPVSRVVEHSPVLIGIGAIVQTVILAEYAPLGDSAHIIRGGFVGSILMVASAWMLGASTPAIILAYFLGGMAGVALSAIGTFRRRTRIMRIETDRLRSLGLQLER